MKRIGDSCRPNGNSPSPLSPLSSRFFPLFRLSILSLIPFPAFIREDSVLYNLILQSRAAVKAADFTSRSETAYIRCTYTHRNTRTKVCRLRDRRYSSDGVLSERKISLSCKEADEKSRGKIARFLYAHIERRYGTRAHILNVYKFERIHRATIVQNF